LDACLRLRVYLSNDNGLSEVASSAMNEDAIRKDGQLLVQAVGETQRLLS